MLSFPLVTYTVTNHLWKVIYQDSFRTPDYFWFDPVSLELKGFRLLDGQYEELSPNDQGWLWSQQLQLFLGIYESKLRLFNVEGEMIPTPEEVAVQERQQREQAQQQLAEMQSLLARYREQFGDLPE